MSHRFSLWAIATALALTVGLPSIAPASDTDKANDATSRAAQILDTTGISGGLIVHVGCGDGRLTAALGQRDGVLVHGLDADPDNVRRARELVHARGLYGPVSIDHLPHGRLPYADGLVNLLVVEQADAVAEAEIMRVLAPLGAAHVNTGDGWRTIDKPWPEEIDEWTHFLHDATGNAVSNDRRVGPPRRMQWKAGPPSARGHEDLASVSAVVSSAGRLFYIADYGPIASVALPSEWKLIARDAFSGVRLWEKPIAKWEWQRRPFRSGPPQLHRRLVAVGDTVYVTLGYGAPLSALDAATGKVRHVYDGTDGTEEIVVADGVIYLVIGDPEGQKAIDAAVRRGQPVPAIQRRIVALECDSGTLLWEATWGDSPELFPLTLAVSDGRAFYQTTDAIVALDAATGEELWRTERSAQLKRRSWSTPTLVVHGDVVLSADQGPLNTPHDASDQDATGPTDTVRWDVTMGGGGQPGTIAAYDAATGKLEWSGPCKQTYNAPPDVFIADDLLWTGELVFAREPGITKARDPETGEVRRQRPADQDFFNCGMSHHRCYRNKATNEYLLLGRSGVEFIDLDSGDAEAHHWVRGTCQYGIVPCNGLLYVPPHTCACFIKAKLNGLNALAAGSPSAEVDAATESPEARLEQSAGREPSEQAAPSDPAADWPTYRHDPARSGVSPTSVPANVEPAWRAELGGKVTPLVIANGRVFVAQTDRHVVHCLHTDSGERLWTFTAGGRVDSPPTIWQGRAIFGCRDGWVYCVGAEDGNLLWRFRVAPRDRRIVSFDRLESAWPVPGSVLVMEGQVYCVAGRSIFLDGGMRLCRLDAATGKLLSETRLSGYAPDSGKQLEQYQRPRGFGMPGLLPDVLSSDGEHVFLRHAVFDLDGRQEETRKAHLFSPVGFLDDTWWHRSYWLWGDDFRAGWAGWWQVGNEVPAGRLLVCTDDEVLGFGRSFMPHGNSGQWNVGESYHVFAAPKQFERPQPAVTDAKGKKRRRNKAVTGRSIVPPRWSHEATLEARAMVLADDILFLAGPLGDTHRSLDAFTGREGILLRAVSIEDGTPLADRRLEAMPRFDGLAAAGGKLYLATADGQVVCFAGGE